MTDNRHMDTASYTGLLKPLGLFSPSRHTGLVTPIDNFENYLFPVYVSGYPALPVTPSLVLLGSRVSTQGKLAMKQKKMFF